MDLQNLVRKNILQLLPYSSARSEFKNKADMFLDANENPFPKLQYNRYPDPLQIKLKQKIQSLHHIPINQIFLGNGSDEAIDVLLRIFCQPKKDKIITLIPTYGIYKVYADIADVQVLQIPLNKDFSLPTTTILKKASPQTKILFINQPNNPTGTLFNQKDLLFLLNNFKGIVVIDEAYIHFANIPSNISLIKKFPNLIVLQTFSKAFGLAGLRLGMAFANPHIIALMNKVKAPYNINSFTQTAAIKALSNTPYYQKIILQIIQERQKLHHALSAFSFVQHIFPSHTNYLLVRFTDANHLYDFLISKGIVVRNRTKDLYCHNCLRITIGTPSENKKLINTLKHYISS